MNTVQLYKYINSITDQIPIIHSYSNKSVYDYWNTEEVKYGSVVFSLKSVSAREDGTTYSGVLYYGDRVLEDRSNVDALYADGTTVIQTILNTLADSEFVEVSYPTTITFFEQEFADQLAGAYANVTLIVRGSGVCDGIIPTLIYPKDEFDPDNYYTSTQVDSLLIRYDALVEEKLEGVVRSTDLAHYVTKEDLDDRGYLDHIPSNYVTKLQLDGVLNEKSYLTHIPDGYVTASYLDEKLEKEGFIREIPTNVVTEEELSSRGFLTEIPSKYITAEELSSRGFLTELPTNVVTEEELSSRGFLTEIPNNLVTKEYLAGKRYLTEIPANYITAEELSSRRYLTEVAPYFVTEDEIAEQHFATQTYVTEKISQIKTNFDPSRYYTKNQSDDKFATKEDVENIDLTDYYTKGEIDDRFATKEDVQNVDLADYYTKSQTDAKFATKEDLEDVDVDLSDYATKNYVAQEIVRVNTNGSIDLSDYATKKELDDAVSDIDIGNYYTKEEVDTALNNIDLDNYYTKGEIIDMIGKINTVLDSVLNDVDTIELNNTLYDLLYEN